MPGNTWLVKGAAIIQCDSRPVEREANKSPPAPALRAAGDPFSTLLPYDVYDCLTAAAMSAGDAVVFVGKILPLRRFSTRKTRSSSPRSCS